MTAAVEVLVLKAVKKAAPVLICKFAQWRAKKLRAKREKLLMKELELKDLTQ